MRETGKLEKRVLDALWRGGESSVREVLDRLGTGHAYTTILTVLQRLHDKGLTRRRRDGAAWLYRAAERRDESIARRMRSILREAGPDREEVLLAFLDAAGKDDPAVLDRLAEMVRARRRERGGR